MILGIGADRDPKVLWHSFCCQPTMAMVFKLSFTDPGDRKEGQQNE